MMSEHSIYAQSSKRLDGFQNKRKRIGNLDFDTASHCVYHLMVHVVFCTKFRAARLPASVWIFLIGLFEISLFAPTVPLLNLEEKPTTSIFCCATRPQLF